MIAKLAVWAETRQAAIERLRRALDDYHVGGITTTLPFFREIARDSEFVAGQLDTGFISRLNQRREAAQPAAPSAEEVDLALVAAAIHYSEAQRASFVGRDQQPQSNWKMSGRTSLLNARETMRTYGKPSNTK
jgi:acetyl/propionyl-CoA carboxylase alpha subunit